MNRLLKSYRVKFGDTQDDLANYLGITLNSYHNKENGKTQFTLNEARKISLKYNKKIEDIFFEL